MEVRKRKNLNLEASTKRKRKEGEGGERGRKRKKGEEEKRRRRKKEREGTERKGVEGEIKLSLNCTDSSLNDKQGCITAQRSKAWVLEKGTWVQIHPLLLRGCDTWKII